MNEELITLTLTIEEALALLAAASISSITYDLIEQEDHIPKLLQHLLDTAIVNAADSFERHRKNVDMENLITRIAQIIPNWCIDA